jgi:hypothetical protein
MGDYLIIIREEIAISGCTLPELRGIVCLWEKGEWLDKRKTV